MRKIAIAAIAAFLVSLGAIPAKAIVFGEDIPDASISYPWVTSIWYAGYDDEYYGPICTGSLIAPDVVLTAAHCIFNSGTYYVQMGSDTLDGTLDSTFYEVDAVWKNPRYSKRTLVNDMGLLKLTEPQTTVLPMPYATRSDIRAVKKTGKFQILGWGVNQSGEEASFLRFTRVSEKYKAAKRLYPVQLFNPETMIAAGRYIKSERVYTGACYGDSGGPLIANIKGVDKVVGITSWGKKGCNTKAPTVFSNVAYYAKDISKGIEIIRKSALVLNRAMPSIESEPSITGGMNQGGTLTCNTGTWSSNTTSVKVKWTEPYSVWNSTKPTISLPSRSYFDTKYTCIVTGENVNGSISRQVSVTIPATPYAYGGATIDGVGYSITPTLNSTLTCSPPSWQTSGVENSFSWYASSSYSLDTNTAQLLGEGNSLVISEAVEAAMLGKSYLHCLVIGSNAGGSARATDYVLVYLPFRR